MSFVSTTFTPAPSGTLFIYYRIPILSFFVTTSRFLSMWRWMRSTIWRALRMVPGCISYIYYQRIPFSGLQGRSCRVVQLSAGTTAGNSGRGTIAVKETYLAVAGRIRREVQELATVVERVQRIWQQAGRSTDDYLVDATALNLHGFYAGIERLLEVIADGIDQTKPLGAHWHQDLLRQMAAEMSGIRPAVLSPQTRDRLERYRGFRHVVRNVYTFNLDPEHVGLLVRQLEPTANATLAELTAQSSALSFPRAPFSNQINMDGVYCNNAVL